MKTAVQKAKGPATAPTVPSHGPNVSGKEKEMNTAIDSTGLASAPALSLSLYGLIASYWQRYDELDASMSRTDDFGYDTPERDAALQEQFAAGNRLDEALFAVCEFVPQLRGDARTRAQFLTLVTEMESGPVCEQILKALLKSLPDLVKFSANGRAA